MSWDSLFVSVYCSLDQSDKATISEVSLTAEVKQPLDVQQFNYIFAGQFALIIFAVAIPKFLATRKNFPTCMRTLASLTIE